VADVRLLRSDLRKLRSRPVTWITLLLFIGLDALVLFSIIIGSRLSSEPATALQMRQYLTFPGAFELTLSRLVGVGGMLAAAFGAAIAGSEWGWGTLKAMIARGESRARLTLTGYVAVTIYACLGLLLVFAVAIALTALAAAATGVDVSGLVETSALAALPGPYLRACVGIALSAAVGYAVATVARSQMAGIVIAIGLYFAESIAGIFAPHVFKWFPFTSSSAVVRGVDFDSAATGGIELAVLDVPTALVVTLAWLIVFLGVAAIYTERAEIGG
jgi:ABC-type transport system involved in multi-copper enzyme maturation permease subunit